MNETENNQQLAKENSLNEYSDLIMIEPDKVATLSKFYNPSVLSKSTEELDLVNSFFEDITCKEKGIEILLYEVIGYSLVKTAKLNKSFIFKR